MVQRRNIDPLCFRLNCKAIDPLRIMAPVESYVKLAQSLPPRLTRFFTRFPPEWVSNSEVISNSNLSTPLLTGQNSKESLPPQVLGPSSLPNPFKPHKHPITRKWHDCVYSLRRQADLVKLAREHGVEELLPFTVKGTEFRRQKRAELGLRVKGTGVDQKVKGHKWERTLRVRTAARKEAMLAMPQLIYEWKKVNLLARMILFITNIFLARTWQTLDKMAQVILG